MNSISFLMMAFGSYAVPGGESRQSLQERGSAAFREIAAAGHEHAAIIAHGRLLAVTLAALVTVPAGPAMPSLENASITTVHCGADGCWDLTAYNQIEHLRHGGLSGAGDL